MSLEEVSSQTVGVLAWEILSELNQPLNIYIISYQTYIHCNAAKLLNCNYILYKILSGWVFVFGMDVDVFPCAFGMLS